MKNFCAILVLSLVLFALVDAQQIRQKCGVRFQLFSAAAANARGLRGTIRRFERALGGNDNGNEPGPLDEGRRSINWDADVVPFNMPGNFFDKDVTRGALFLAAKQEFRVSNPAMPPPVDNRFSSILPRAVTRRFKTFSPKRLFTPFERNLVTQVFKIPASNKRANTAGFGAIFTDVNRVGKTYIDFFTRRGCLLWRLPIKPSNSGLSFGGLYILQKKPVIWRVVIKLGTVSVKQAGSGSYTVGGGDVVVLDDLIYGEPM